MRRLINAVCGQPLDRPALRVGPALAVGVTVSCLLAAGAAIRDRIAAPEAWRRPGAVIVETETGREFVFVGGELHQVPNYTSARLAVGRAQASIIAVAHATLARARAGRPWGIAGLPDRLPSSEDLVASWSVCAVGTDARLAFGVSVHGRSLAGRGADVQAPDGSTYILTNAALKPLGHPNAAFPIPAELLAAVPVDPRVPVPQDIEHAPGALCAITDGNGTSVVSGATPPGVRVAVPATAGALVASDRDPGSISLLADDGRRYPIAGSAAQTSLGYAGLPALVLPAEVFVMLPEGPRLSIAEARGSGHDGGH